MLKIVGRRKHDTNEPFDERIENVLSLRHPQKHSDSDTQYGQFIWGSSVGKKFSALNQTFESFENEESGASVIF
jgi:hypothetical protein